MNVVVESSIFQRQSLEFQSLDLIGFSILGIPKMAGIVTWRYAYRIVTIGTYVHACKQHMDPVNFGDSGTETRAIYSLGKYQ